MVDRQIRTHDEHVSTDSVDNDDVVPSENSLKTLRRLISEQDREFEEFLLEFFKAVLRLRGVRIDRDAFLKSELHKRGVDQELIARAIKMSPLEVGIPVSTIDDIAESAIKLETRKSSAMSLATGLPGLAGSLALMPADITQFYAHAFRIIQKTAYAYGWQSLLIDTQEVDDETLFKMVSFLGVMSGASVAAITLREFLQRETVSKAVSKAVEGQALTKTVWYIPLKRILKLVGVKLNKPALSKSVGGSIPVISGIISGGFTFVALQMESRRLLKYLRETPPPNVDSHEYLRLIQEKKTDDDSEKAVLSKVLSGAVTGAITVTSHGRKALSSTSEAVKAVATRGATQVTSRVQRRRAEKSSHAEEVDYLDGDSVD